MKIKLLFTLGLLLLGFQQSAYSLSLRDDDGSKSANFVKVMSEPIRTDKPYSPMYNSRQEVVDFDRWKQFVDRSVSHDVAWFQYPKLAKTVMPSDLVVSLYWLDGDLVSSSYVGAYEGYDASGNLRTMHTFSSVPNHIEWWNPYVEKRVTMKPAVVEYAGSYDKGTLLVVAGFGHEESTDTVDKKGMQSVWNAYYTALDMLITVGNNKGLFDASRNDEIRRFMIDHEHPAKGGVYSGFGFGVIGAKTLVLYIDETGGLHDQHSPEYIKWSKDWDYAHPYERREEYKNILDMIDHVEILK